MPYLPNNAFMLAAFTHMGGGGMGRGVGAVVCQYLRTAIKPVNPSRYGSNGAEQTCTHTLCTTHLHYNMAGSDSDNKKTTTDPDN